MSLWTRNACTVNSRLSSWRGFERDCFWNEREGNSTVDQGKVVLHRCIIAIQSIDIRIDSANAQPDKISTKFAETVRELRPVTPLKLLLPSRCSQQKQSFNLDLPSPRRPTHHGAPGRDAI
jgi:hypothetical protein